jgi:hypothetical protein
MEIGIIGLPNAGKSTLFNALTKAGAEVAKYPFTTIESNIGVAEVPDQRLHLIAEVVKPQRIIPATIKFVDIAGLVRGASQGEGLGNQFLSFIRNVDAILHVVRCFNQADIPHPYGQISPKVDIETVNLELALADLEIVTRAYEKAKRQAKSSQKEASQRVETLGKIKAGLERGELIRLMFLSEEEKEIIKDLGTLTDKPVLYVANISEEDITNADNVLFGQVKDVASREQAGVVAVSAKVEAEIAELEVEEARLFQRELGLSESGLSKVVRNSYQLLNLITFFTIESSECRAWPIKKDTKAPQAAGKIHSDMERGFIKAEVVFWEDLVNAGSFTAARGKGLLSIEGKDYKVRDGDVILFKFSV